MAQEGAEVLPEAVQQGEDGFYSVDVSALVPVLMEAVKTLQRQNEERASQIEQLQERVQRLEASTASDRVGALP